MSNRYEELLQDQMMRLERKIRLSPINLGGIVDSGGGTGIPPGGFIGMLTQTRVAYDTTEAAMSGYSNPNPYTESGILVGASLLDNLNHIRYRIQILESGGTSGQIAIYDNDVLVASGITSINFGDGLDVTLDTATKVSVDTVLAFLGLTDTPNNYTGYANNVVAVKADETGLEFISLGSGSDSFKSKVSANDTIENYLENKIVAGSGISVTVLNDGSNEQIEISTTVSGITNAIRTKVIVFGQSGNLTVKSLEPRIHAPFAGTISNVTAAVNTAPVGSSILVDVNKNGTTIFTTQGNRPTIASTNTEDLSSIPDIVNFSDGDVFTVDIDQIGSTTAGSDLVVQIRCVV